MTRLFDLLYNQLQNHPLDTSISGRQQDGKWRSYSTKEFVSTVEKAASGLLNMGLKQGDKVAIVAYKNRPEWVIMDFATQLVGIINIPLYPTISAHEYEYILNEADVVAAFCGGSDLYDKLLVAKDKVPSLQQIYTFDKQDGRMFWEDIFVDTNFNKVEAIKETIKSDELATIIYTSGTTGKPKGVMLTHQNILHVIKATSQYLLVEAGENVISFLPLCHIFERTVSMAYIFKGVSIYFAGTDNLAGPTGDLAAIKPAVFTTVPRLLEKIYEAIYNKGLALEGAKKKLFFWALRLTDKFELNQKLSFGSKLKWKLADKLIFSKWRAALGGNIRMVVTGAAPCPVNILRVFCAAGIPICEGYGLTETSPTLTVNTMEENGAMLGTVGPLIKGVELLIDNTEGDYKEEEGEILARGPNVMIGYYNKPEINAEVFKEIDGKRWFRTGDIGKLVKGPGGRDFLKITDRKKELLKTSGGKYVAPAPIENRIREDFLVEQMMVVGDKRKFVSALIVPAPEALKNWCRKKNIEWTNLQEMIEHKQVVIRYQKVIIKYNMEFSHIEQVKKFQLIAGEWLPNHESGAEAELTPTLKLKRRVIREKYSQEIESMYTD